MKFEGNVARTMMFGGMLRGAMMFEGNVAIDYEVQGKMLR